MASYDIIGDIHGQLGKLRRLLAKLGYENVEGVYRHATRQAVFVGDFIDRGPSIRETLAIVRRMIDSGSALGVLGNHEFNAIRHAASPDARFAMELRDTLGEFAAHQDEWKSYLEWFQKLPLFLDLAKLRIVHAVWDERLIAAITNGQRQSRTSFWPTAVKPETDLGKAVSSTLNGYRLPLPNDIVIEEFAGSMRSTMRIAWWKNDPALTYRNASLPHDPNLPETPLSEAIRTQIHGYNSDEPPVFVGHYALPPDLVPWPQADNVACVDYRAAKKGPLVAYRWDGEQRLEPTKFVSSE